MAQEPESSPEAVRFRTWMRTLVQRGWCQGQYFKRGWRKVTVLESPDRVCLVGAMNLAWNRLNPWDRVLAEVEELLATAIGEPGHPEFLPAWNDVTGRRKRHVLALIDSILARTRK